MLSTASVTSSLPTPSAEPTPEEKATSIINSVPSTSLFTKTSGVLLGTGLTAAAISSELYVANEETVLAVGFFVILAAVASSIGAPYNSWANGHIEVRCVVGWLLLASADCWRFRL